MLLFSSSIFKLASHVLLEMFSRINLSANRFTKIFSNRLESNANTISPHWINLNGYLNAFSSLAVESCEYSGEQLPNYGV